METNKELIKHYRKIKEQAVELWKREKNDVFRGMEDDPVVSLLLSALAYQSYNIQRNIDNFQENVIQELRDRLIPYNLIKPLPAFSVVKTRIKKDNHEDSHIMLDESAIFEFVKSKKKFRFVPLFETKIINAELLSRDYLDSNKISIVLQPEADITDISGMSFYFTHPDYNEMIDIKISYNGREFPLIKPSQYYKYPFTKWFSNDHLILKNNKYLFGTHEYWQEIFFTRKVQLFYIDKYNPKDFVFRDDENIELEIEIDLKYPHIDIEDIEIHINCAPIVNVEKREVSLNDREPIKRLSSDNEKFLNLLYDKDNGNPEKITESVLIRNSGIERYNGEQILSQLRDIIDRYTSDYYAFRSVGGLKNSDKLENLRIILEEINNIIEQENRNDLTDHYAIFKLDSNMAVKPGSIDLEYLITSEDLANGIKYREKAQNAPAKFDKNETYLLMETKGGRKTIESEEQKNNIAKYYSLTKDKIITYNDIILFCRKELDENIENIYVQKESGNIKVMILLKEDCRYKDEELESLAEILEMKLKIHSSGYIPVKMSITKE